MNRRTFLAGSTSLITTPFIATAAQQTETNALVFGHNEKRYQPVKNWGVIDPNITPVENCHEFVEDSQGRLILFQTHVKNNIIIYSKEGKLLDSWGTQFEGAHGMSLVTEQGEDFLYLTDTRGHIFKTDLKGKILFEIKGLPDLPPYKETNLSGKPPKFSPTNIMPAPDGTFYVGDGYGMDFILHLDAKGKLLHYFGGKGNEPHELSTAHGGMVDTSDPSNPVLIICSRGHESLKFFTLDGKYIKTIHLPGQRVCQIKKRGS